jgi:hypothetical protein
VKFIKFGRHAFNLDYINRIETFDNEKEKQYRVTVYIHGCDSGEHEWYMSKTERDARFDEVLVHLNGEIVTWGRYDNRGRA